MVKDKGIDPLNQEVGITANLDSTGMSVKAKSRTISAIDHLCGNFFFNLGAKQQEKATVTQERVAAYRKVSQAMADQMSKQIKADTPDGRRMLEKF